VPEGVNEPRCNKPIGSGVDIVGETRMRDARSYRGDPASFNQYGSAVNASVFVYPDGPCSDDNGINVRRLKRNLSSDVNALNV
jgi:hypothetical protein